MLHQPCVSVPAASCVVGDNVCMQSRWFRIRQVEHSFLQPLACSSKLAAACDLVHPAFQPQVYSLFFSMIQMI